MKRPNSSKMSKRPRKLIKRKPTEAKPPEVEPEDWSEGSSEEDLGSTKYDNLLSKLGSKSKALARALKRRKREEEGGDDAESSDEDADLENDMGSDDDSAVGTEAKYISECSDENSEASQSDDDEIDDSDMDEKHDLKTALESSTEACLSTSAIRGHLDYKLSKVEGDTLLKRKCKYEWEVPILDAPNCKWRGTGKCFLKDTDLNNSEYGLKPRLNKHLLDIYKGSGVSDSHLAKQRYFFSIYNSYRDILYHNKKPFYFKGSKEDSYVMDAYVTHCLNHIFKTKDLLTKNTARLANSEGKADLMTGGVFLDQGFTRPKVLILLPLASVAFRVVKRLIQLTPPKYKAKVEHFDRFAKEFGSGVEEDEQDKDDIEVFKGRVTSKPSDHQALFGGNNKDDFMMGIKYMGSKIKLYADFYSSDIIVAAPLGLIMKMEEARSDSDVASDKDVDYLSSIEVLIIDHADVMLAQNWSHVDNVVQQLNRLPSKQHRTDIMRIRPWYLDGQAQYYRQTIILSSHLNPDINSTFNRHCLNYQGKIKSDCTYKGVLPKVLLQVPQIYQRFDARLITDADDARFEYFCKKVFPKIKDSIQGGVMIFISSYFDLVRVRNFLKSQEASFCLLTDYTKQADISRARVWFFQQQRKLMLYTERIHFFYRYKIRGIKKLIIYSLPERKELYPEIVNMLEGSEDMSCTVLFSRFDQLKMERIVGSDRAKKMTTSEKGVFVISSETSSNYV